MNSEKVFFFLTYHFIIFKKKKKKKKKGNWVLIKFRSKLDYQKALTKNGKLIFEKRQDIMIGVLPTSKVNFLFDYFSFFFFFFLILIIFYLSNIDKRKNSRKN